MSPDAATAVREAQFMLTYLVAIIFILGGTVAWLCNRLDRGCNQCGHCQDKIRREEQKQREARQALDRRLGLPGSTSDDAVATRERLFGRSVVPVEDESPVAPVEGSSGDEVSDAESEDPGR